jgi:RNA polymerase sigma-70 factor (ECF subfamily)
MGSWKRISKWCFSDIFVMPPAVEFPDTIWTWIEKDSRSPECCEWFCETYRPVVLAYLQLTMPGQDAEDVCQDFFAKAVLERGFLEQADRSKGRLRSYLRAALDHFVISRRRAVLAEKRGGRAWHVPLDGLERVDEFAGLADPRATPDEIFDREWAIHLMGQAIESARRDFASRDRLAVFEALLPLLNRAEFPLEAIAAPLGMSARYVSVCLSRLRQRIGKHLEAEVGRTVRHPAMVHDELDAVRRALAQA